MIMEPFKQIGNLTLPSPRAGTQLHDPEDHLTLLANNAKPKEYAPLGVRRLR